MSEQMSEQMSKGRSAGRPIGTKAERVKVKLSFTIDADLYDEVSKQANRSAFISAAIRRALGK